MEKNGILVIGSSNTDMVIRVQRIPTLGESVMGGEFMMNPGGKGANQAVAAARLQGKITFITKVGNDIFGEEALKHYEKEGIDIRFAKTDPQLPSGTALIMVDPKGDNCLAVAPGANGNLTPADIDEAKAAFADASLILMQLETPMETILHVCEIARDKKIILNPAPAAQLPAAVLDCLYAITPNQTEAELLTGVKVDSQEAAEEAAKVFQKMGVQNVLITMGSKGAFIRSGEVSEFVPAEKVKALDTTAAGDTFNGALCVGLAEGMSLAEATRFANKAAAISVTRLGAQASTPYRHELNH